MVADLPRIADVAVQDGTAAVKERFVAVGAEVQPSSAEELAAYIREDLAQWVKVVKQAGIKVE